MASLTDEQYRILNISAISFGSAALIVATGVLALAAWLRSRVPRTFKQAFESFPTRILYASLALSIVHAGCYIWASTSSASNQGICAFTMTGVVMILHLMDAAMLLILLHCAILLTSRRQEVAVRVTAVASAIGVMASIAFAFAGLFTHAYRYSESQATCWIFEPGRPDGDIIPKSLYGFESAILYGPVFASLLLSVCLFIYILISLRFIGQIRANKSFKRMIIRLGVTPVFLFLHCLMILSGDLPITYQSSSSMFASFWISFVGFGSFGLCFAFCAIFVDPALNTCWRAAFKKREPIVEHSEASEELKMDGKTDYEITTAV